MQEKAITVKSNYVQFNIKL